MRTFIEKNKKIIFSTIIVLLIILIICYFILSGNQNKNVIPDKDVKSSHAPEQIDYINEWKGKVNDITDLGDYYIIKNIVNKFYSYFPKEGEPSKAILDLLSKEYVEKNQITEENIKDYFPQIQQNEVYLIEGYHISDYERNKTYIVKCWIRDIATGNFTENELIIVCDILNNTFCIYPDEYVKSLNLGEIGVGTEISLNFDLDIVKNSNNLYGAGAKDFNDYSQDVFESYRKLLLIAPEKAYELLDDEFKKQYYPDFSKFKEFIDQNRTDIFLMTYSSYESSIGDEYNTFSAYDKNDKFYITFDTKSLINLKYKIKKFI